MMSQKHVDEPGGEHSDFPYGRYEGEQPVYPPQREEPQAAPFLREGFAEKANLQPRENTNLFRLLTFVIAMAALLGFAYVCLVLVSGTGGWIGFCAAAFAIMIIASTAISVKRPDEK